MNKKKSRKGAIIFLSILLISSIAIGGLWVYFAQVKPTFNVQQSITIDGKNHNEPIIFTHNVTAGDVLATFYNLKVNTLEPVNITATIATRPGVDITFELDGRPTTFPVRLRPGEYELSIIYTFDVQLKPGVYKPTIKFGVE